VCKYSNALLRRWILGEVEMIGAKTHPEFVDLAVRQVARGMKGVELKGGGGSRKRSESKIHRSRAAFTRSLACPP
jgi:hypothetical protein